MTWGAIGHCRKVLVESAMYIVVALKVFLERSEELAFKLSMSGIVENYG